MGEIVLGAPWSRALDVRFHGRSAHAGMAPEEGRSAIQAAAKAIADLRLGRVDEVTTANVGTITGGTAGNIVPEWCSFDAEARSHDERSSGRSCRRCSTRAAFAASEMECEVRDRGRARATTGIASSATSRRSRSPRRRSRVRATSHAMDCPAAGPTRTSSTSAASGASISRTAMVEIHTPGRAHRGRRPRGDGRRDGRARGIGTRMSSEPDSARSSCRRGGCSA